MKANNSIGTNIYRSCFTIIEFQLSSQPRTHYSFFFLLYGRNARVPTESAFLFQRSPYVIDYDDYKEDLINNLSSDWKNAQMHIAKAQSDQKRYYDR